MERQTTRTGFIDPLMFALILVVVGLIALSQLAMAGVQAVTSNSLIIDFVGLILIPLGGLLAVNRNPQAIAVVYSLFLAGTFILVKLSGHGVGL